MTQDQAAARQAAHENLIRELVDALQWARNYIDTIVDPRALPVLLKIDLTLEKVQGEHHAS